MPTTYRSTQRRPFARPHRCHPRGDRARRHHRRRSSLRPPGTSEGRTGTRVLAPYDGRGAHPGRRAAAARGPAPLPRPSGTRRRPTTPTTTSACAPSTCTPTNGRTVTRIACSCCWADVVGRRWGMRAGQQRNRAGGGWRAAARRLAAAVPGRARWAAPAARGADSGTRRGGALPVPPTRGQPLERARRASISRSRAEPRRWPGQPWSDLPQAAPSLTRCLTYVHIMYIYCTSRRRSPPASRRNRHARPSVGPVRSRRPISPAFPLRRLCPSDTVCSAPTSAATSARRLSAPSKLTRPLSFPLSPASARPTVPPAACWPGVACAARAVRAAHSSSTTSRPRSAASSVSTGPIDDPGAAGLPAGWSPCANVRALPEASRQ